MTTKTAETAAARKAMREALMPVIVDVGVPIATYYALTKVVGFSQLAALGLSSVWPVVRIALGLAKERRINPVAVLILGVNAVGLLLSLVSGDARLMVAKDSGVTGVVGLAILVSTIFGRPLMSVLLRPAITKGDPAELAAFDRLSATSAEFRRAERIASVVWGAALFGEAAVRVVGAYTLPIDTMVWLGPVILVAALVLAVRISMPLGTKPMAVMSAEATQKA